MLFDPRDPPYHQPSLHPSLVPPISSSSHLDETVPGNGDGNSLEPDSEPRGLTVGPITW